MKSANNFIDNILTHIRCFPQWRGVAKLCHFVANRFYALIVTIKKSAVFRQTDLNFGLFDKVDPVKG